MKNFIKALPKVELHLHIEGTLEPEMMFAMAKRNHVSLPYKSVEDVRSAYQFADLSAFLDLYYLGASVLIHEKDFYELTWAYLQKMAKENVRHVEIFFDPQTHTMRGIDFDVVIAGIHRALLDAKKQFNMSSQLIMCFLRHLSERDAFDVYALAKKHLDKIIGVGLDSAEVGYPPEKFERVFAKARADGLLAVAHAGEEGPAGYIWQALDLLKVERIDHGVRAIEDMVLIKYLTEHQTPLTVCPLSNIALRIYPSLKQHPFKKLLNQGVCVTINSDDPSYFGGYLSENYLATQFALGLTRRELVKVVTNSIQAAFLTRIEKRILLKELAEVDRWYKSHPMAA